MLVAAWAVGANGFGHFEEAHPKGCATDEIWVSSQDWVLPTDGEGQDMG